MADNENIGGIEIQIVGNYSTLQGDIDSAAQVAQKGGEEIAAALNTGAAGADALSSAVTTAAAAVGDFDARIEALVASGSTLAEALAQVSAETAGIAAGMDQAAVGVQGLGEAEQKAGEQAQTGAQDTKDFGDAAQHSGQASHEAAGGVAEMLGELLKVAGITASIEAIREFGVACFETGAEEERMGEGIAFMRGNIEGADEEITKLRELAQQLAEPFDSVGKAAQNFAFLKFSAADAADAMQVADDASKASGRSFDSLANSLANISMSVSLMPRALKQLGITAQELSDTMGMSFDKIKAAWKGMDEASKLDALMASMSAVRGASKAMGDDAESNMTRFSNAWKAAMGDVGTVLTPFVTTMLPAVSAALKGVATAAIETIGGIKALVDVMAGMVRTALDSVMGLGQAISLAMQGNISQALVIAATTTATMAQDAKNTWNTFAMDAANTTAAVKKLWADQAVSAKDSSDSQSESWAAAARAAAAAALAAAGSSAELKKENAEVAAFAKGIAPALAEAAQSYDDYTLGLMEGGKKASSILSQLTQDIAKGEAEAAKMSGAPKAAMEEWISKLKEAQATMNDFASQDAMTEALNKIQDKWSAYALKVAAESEKINEQMTADAQKAAMMEEQGSLTHQEKMLEIARTTAEKEAAIHDITVFDKLAKDTDLYAKEDKLANDALTKELAILDESTTAQVDYASKREAIILRIQALQDKINGREQVTAIEDQTAAWKVLGIESDKALATQIKEANQALAILVQQKAAQGDLYAAKEKALQLEITSAERTGADANAQVVQLNNIRLLQKALSDDSHLWGDTEVKITNDIIAGFVGMSHGMAQVIVEGGKMGQVFVDTGKKIAEAVLNDIINAGLQKIVDFIVKDVLPAIGIHIAKVGATTVAIHAMQVAMHEATVAMSADITALSAQFDKLTASITGTGAGGAGGGAGGAAGGGAMGVAGAIGSIVGALASIYGDVQMSHLISTAGKIEENTRRMDIVFEKYAQSDEWDRHTGILAKWDDQYTRLGDIWNEIRTGWENIVSALGIAGALPAAVPPGGTPPAGTPGAPPSGGQPPDESGARSVSPGPLSPGITQPAYSPAALSAPAAIPSLPSIPYPSPATQSGFSTTGLGTIGSINITVNAATDPRETARQLADTLRTMSGKFSAYAQ